MVNKQKTCTYAGCTKTIIARGLCRQHYNRDYMQKRRIEAPPGTPANTRRARLPKPDMAEAGRLHVGYVYFAFTTLATPLVMGARRVWKPMHVIKIGFSHNWRNRNSQLQSTLPVPLEFIFVARAYSTTERDLHALFAHHHVRGEWFNAKPVIAWLEQMKARAVGKEWAWMRSVVVHNALREDLIF